MTALTVEQVKELFRELFMHYGWTAPDMKKRAKIQAARDLALAALSERGEPVAEVTYSNWNGMNVCILRDAGPLPVGTKLYAHPQAGQVSEQNAAQEEQKEKASNGDSPPAAAPSEYPQTEAEYHAEAVERYADSDYGNNIDIQTTTAAPSEFVRVSRDDLREIVKALADLSFACFAGIGLQTPDMKTYNDTFQVLQRAKAMLAAAPPCQDRTGQVMRPCSRTRQTKPTPSGSIKTNSQ